MYLLSLRQRLTNPKEQVHRAECIVAISRMPVRSPLRHARNQLDGDVPLTDVPLQGTVVLWESEAQVLGIVADQIQITSGPVTAISEDTHYIVVEKGISCIWCQFSSVYSLVETYCST